MILRIVNLIFLSIVVISAFRLINIRYQSRNAYALLAELQLQADKLNKEYTRLQLEEGTYSSNLVLQDFALHKFGLIKPDKKHIVEVK